MFNRKKKNKIIVDFNQFCKYDERKPSYYFCQIQIGDIKVSDGAKTMQEAYKNAKNMLNELIDKEIGAFNALMLDREKEFWEDKQC